MTWRSTVRLGLTLVGVPAIMLGAASIVISFGCVLKSGFASRRIPPSFEMPLGHPQGIVVDSHGNIYCGLQFYSRVQVYDPQGQYRYGVFIYANAGAFRIRINQYDQLEVVTVRNPTLYVIGEDGVLVRQSRESLWLFEAFGDKHDREFYDKRGEATYRIIPALFRPKIVKIDSAGRRKILVETPFSKGLWKGPFPAFLFLLVGSGVLTAARSKFLRSRLS